MPMLCSLSSVCPTNSRCCTLIQLCQSLHIPTFVDLSGPKPESERRERNTLIVRDDFSRMSWVYFLRHKSDAAEAFERFLVDVRADGMPSSVEIVRSDGGGEFEGRFADLCRTRGIKQEFTTADSPEYNGVAERALGMIDAAARSAIIQAQELYPHVQLPSTESLWAEAYRWACDSINRTASSANPDWKSPHEMWHGTTASLKLMPFLKPGFCKVRRANKSENKAQECFYLGPPSDCPADAMRMFTRHRYVITLRNVTWRRSPPSPSFSQDASTASDGPFDEEKINTSAGKQPIVMFSPNPTAEPSSTESPSAEPASTLTTSRTATRQLGAHNKGNDDEVREGKTRGQTKKIREGVLSASDGDLCGQLLHALVGIESGKPAVSIPPIPLSDYDA